VPPVAAITTPDDDQIVNQSRQPIYCAIRQRYSMAIDFSIDISCLAQTFFEALNHEKAICVCEAFVMNPTTGTPVVVERT